MCLKRLIDFWIATSVAVALLLAPLAANAGAHQMPTATTGDMLAMSADMPCCPDEEKAKDCDSCPLFALCMLTISIPLPSEASTLTKRDLSGEAFAVQNDEWIDGLGARPPDHPPRRNV